MISELSKFPYVHLEDICNINIGKTPSRSNMSYWGKGYTWISISDMNSKEVLFDSKEEITELGLLESGIKTVKAGSLLFSFKLSIGKVAFAGKDLFTNEAIAALDVRDSSKVDSKYLFYVLKEFDFTATGDKAVKGITLNKAKLKRLKIPLPPLSTQQQIARILDQTDALRKKTQQVIELYDQLAQSIFLDMFGDPVRNPKGWEVKKMTEVCGKVTDGTHDTPRRLKEGIKFITGKHIRPFSIDFNASDYVTPEVHHEIYKRCNPQYGDVLYTNIGVNLGTAAINTVDYEFSMKNVALLKPRNEVLIGKYLEHFLNDRNLKAKIVWMTSLGGAQQFLSLKDIRRLDVLCPPITLQNQFAEKISLIEKQKELAKQSLQESENLFNSLLQKAFKGELVNSV